MIHDPVRVARQLLFGLALSGLAFPQAASAEPPAAGETEASVESEELADTAARYFCSYAPTYFTLGIAERDRTNPTTKFQFSFQTMLLDLSPSETFLDSCSKPIGRHLLHFGYTQKSIWNLYAESAPFEESNYNPEIFYSYHVRDLGSTDGARWGSTSRRRRVETRSNSTTPAFSSVGPIAHRNDEVESSSCPRSTSSTSRVTGRH
jgi:hypothetical protein